MNKKTVTCILALVLMVLCIPLSLTTKDTMSRSLSASLVVIAGSFAAGHLSANDKPR